MSITKKKKKDNTASSSEHVRIYSGDLFERKEDRSLRMRYVCAFFIVDRIGLDEHLP